MIKMRNNVYKGGMIIRFLSVFLISLIIIGMFPMAAYADNIGSINNPATTGEELRSAMLQANRGDTIYITSMALSGQIYLENGYDGCEDEIDVIIRSVGSANAVIDASKSPSPYYSFNFHGIKKVTLTFEDVIIDGGGVAGSIRFSRGGGGVPQPDRILTLNNAVMQNCMGQNNGGAVHVDWDNIVANNCTFTGNRTVGHGGAIFVREGGATIHGCTFMNNEAVYTGGAVSVQTKGNYYGTAAVTGCEFIGNSSGSSGGGLFGSGEIKVDTSIFDGNSSMCGGAILNYEYPVTIQNSKISGNTATVTNEDVLGYAEQYTQYGEPRDLGLDFDNWLDYCSYSFGGGGGIYSTGAVTVNNTKVIDNTSGYNGGGIWVSDLTTLNVSENVTFSENSADSAWFMSDLTDIQTHETNVLTLNRSDSPINKPVFAYAYNNYDIVYLKGDHADDVPNIATYYTVHYLESGTGNALHGSKTQTQVQEKDVVLAVDEVLPINGYVYDHADKDRIVIGKDSNNNVLTIYYAALAPTEQSYTVHYLEQGTDAVLHAPKMESAAIGGEIIAQNEVITIDGYEVERTTSNIVIDTESVKNTITIYYTKKVEPPPEVTETGITLHLDKTLTDMNNHPLDIDRSFNMSIFDMDMNLISEVSVPANQGEVLVELAANTEYILVEEAADYFGFTGFSVDNIGLLNGEHGTLAFRTTIQGNEHGSIHITVINQWPEIIEDPEVPLSQPDVPVDVPDEVIVIPVESVPMAPPQTGDYWSNMPYIALAVISVVILIVAIIRKRKLNVK